MARKTTRLRFTEDDLANGKVRKAAAKAEKAADKADRAKEKLPVKRKLTREPPAAANRKGKLRFEEVPTEKPSRAGRAATHAPAAVASAQLHHEISEHGDDNAGIQAADRTTGAAETAVRTVDYASYSGKLRAHEKAERLEAKADRANVEALYQKSLKDNPDDGSNPISRWRQKQAIRKEYAAAQKGHHTAAASGGAKGAEKAAKGTKNITERASEFVSAHPKAILLVLGCALMVLLLSSALSSCSVLFQGGGNMVLGSSYTAEDEDILGANADYTALENELRNKINNIESTYPGYDEYRYELDEINHNPYELTSYLTVLFEDYTREEVQAALAYLFDQQYELTLTEEVEIRTRTETRTGTLWVYNEVLEDWVEVEYEYEVEVEYEYAILHVALDNKGLGAVVAASGLTEDQMQRYALLMQTKGNRPYLFEDDIYATTGPYTDYDIPGEALTDERFANMIREAEKYLGYPYVWGGSSPETSFDCSGYVSWVINHCGNGWNVGRLTADGLKNVCAIIPPSEAKPGDLIFFQGTYDTTGASHVGIYVGNGMMLHCGNPVSYTSIESSYWQAHFYCFGRLP